MNLDIESVPMKWVCDWQSLVPRVLAGETVLLAADINMPAARLSLHRKGISVYPIRVNGAIVAHSVELARHKHKATK